MNREPSVDFSYGIAGTGKAGTLATVAVTIDPKPRLRLPSGDIPEPKVVHSRSWLPFAVATWIATVVVGHGLLYGWLPWMKSTSPVAPDVTTSTLALLAEAPPNPTPSINTPSPLPSTPPSIDPDHMPSCDEATRQVSTDDGEVPSLPTDLSRSPFGVLLDSQSWTKRCRGPGAVRVHLCVAVKDGQLLGATARTEPDDPSTSRCIMRALSRLVFEPDSSLRKVHVTIDVPSDRGRH